MSKFGKNKDKDKASSSGEISESNTDTAGATENKSAIKGEPKETAKPIAPSARKGKGPVATFKSRPEKPQHIETLSNSLGVTKVKLSALMAHYGWTTQTVLLRNDFIEKMNSWSTAKG